MKIVGKFKDYFDYISHQLGADPSVVLFRKPIKIDDSSVLAPFAQAFVFRDYVYPSDPYAPHYSAEYLVAGAYVFELARITTREATDPKLHLPDHYRDVVTCEVYDAARHAAMLRGETPFEVRHGFGKSVVTKTPDAAQLRDLIRAVGAPVFIVCEYREGIRIEERVPCLKDCGIPALVPAQVMWQNLYTTLTSVLRRDPDKEPPLTISNSDRIEAAGFDVKTSFRHPVNPKPRKAGRSKKAESGR